MGEKTHREQGFFLFSLANEAAPSIFAAVLDQYTLTQRGQPTPPSAVPPLSASRWPPLHMPERFILMDGFSAYWSPQTWDQLRPI